MEEEKKIIETEEVKPDKIEINSNVVSLEQFENLQKQFDGLNEQISKHSRFIEEYYKSSATVTEDITKMKW